MAQRARRRGGRRRACRWLHQGRAGLRRTAYARPSLASAAALFTCVRGRADLAHRLVRRRARGRQGRSWALSARARGLVSRAAGSRCFRLDRLHGGCAAHRCRPADAHHRCSRIGWPHAEHARAHHGAVLPFPQVLSRRSSTAEAEAALALRPPMLRPPRPPTRPQLPCSRRFSTWAGMRCSTWRCSAGPLNGTRDGGLWRQMMRRRFGSLNVEYAVYRVESVPSGSARLMVIMPGARHSSPRATLVPRRDVAYETRCIEHNFAWPTCRR